MSVPTDNSVSINQLLVTLRTFRTQLQTYRAQLPPAKENTPPDRLGFILGWIKHIDGQLEMHECDLIQPPMPLLERSKRWIAET